MKVTVSKFLNVRVGAPSVNAPNYQYLAPGSIIEIDGNTYEGDNYEGNPIWYKDAANNYYWSGGIEGFSSINAHSEENNIDSFWWLKDYNIDKLWEAAPSGVNIKVAVLDTGLALPHPDLKIHKESVYDVTESQTTTDWSGHGTHVCGIVKAAHNHEVYGINPNVDLFFVKVTHDVVGDHLEYLKKGIDWAVQQNVDIISISKGFQNDNLELKESIAKAIQKKILVVCAAGNKINDAHVNIDFPARYSDTLSVGGLQKNKTQLADTVNSEQTDLFAPGFEILSTFKNSSYIKMTGSSQAAPFVTGVASLLLQIAREKDPSYAAIDLKKHLIATSDSTSFGKITNPLNSLKSII